MTADNNPNYTFGGKGHFCGGCDKQRFLHDGCVADDSFRVSPNDPLVVAARSSRVTNNTVSAGETFQNDQLE